MKKSAFILTSLLLAVSQTVVCNASEFLNVSYPNDDSVLIINGNTGLKGNVSIRVFALGEDGDDFFEGDSNFLDNITENDIRDNPGMLDYFNIIKTDNAGNYEFKYKTTGDSGFYYFTVTAADGKQESMLYEYYSPEYAVEKIAELNVYIQNNEEDKVTEFLNRYTAPLAAENDYFTKIQNESYFSGIAPKIIEGGAVKDKTDLRQRIRIATARVCLENFMIPNESQEETETEKMLEYFTEFGLLEDPLYTTTLQKTVTSEVKLMILRDFSGVNAKNDSEMKQQLDDLILLGAVNYSAWGKIQAVIEENIKLFPNSAVSDYNSLSDIKKANVAKEMAEDVAGSGYASLEELKDGFSNAVSKQNTVTVPERPGGSGGGGSSSGGGGGGYFPTTAVKPDNDEETEDSANPQKPDNKKTFSDLDKAEWSREAVEFLAGEGIISGRSDTEFAPNENITREEFLAIAVRAFGLLDENAKCSFSDVPESAWFYSAVASAYNEGITSGVSDTMFGAGENITRQDMCVLAYKSANIAGITLEEGELSFDDTDEISEYARDCTARMSFAGIVNGVGDNKFAPRDTATRASAAKIIYELLKLR